MQRVDGSLLLRGLAVAAIAVLVVIGLSRISFNVDILRLLPTHLAQVRGLRLFLENFSQPNELIITVEAPDASPAEAAADAIAGRLDGDPHLASRALSRPPWEKQPGELAQLVAFLALNEPPETVRALAERLSPAQAPATLRATLDRLGDSVSPQEIGMLSYDPFGMTGALAGSTLLSEAQQSEFASADGTFHVVYVEAPHPFSNYNETVAWIAEIRRATARWQGVNGVRLGFTGEPAIVASIASSMQGDMQSSGLVTLLIIALVFWLCYRRVWPLLELQGMLLLIFTLTLAIAGLFFDQLTVIGVGSAAIMIGLSVDYGYFIYQRSQRHTGTLRELQRQCLRYIIWTSGTTAAAFFALNVSSLPGLSQLGNLVGVGVVVGAVVMLTIFAPLTLRRHQRETSAAVSGMDALVASQGFHRAGAWVTLVIVAVLVTGLAVKGLPGADFSARPLRPRSSEAYAALDRLSQRLMNGESDPLSLVVTGESVETVRVRLAAAESQLASAQKRGDVRSFRTALTLWPDAANQRANLAMLLPLTRDTERLRQAVLDAGFKEEAFNLTAGVLEQMAAWAKAEPPIWPDNDSGRWILRRLARHARGQWLALGYVQPTPGRGEALAHAITGADVYLTGWPLLDAELRHVIPREFGLAILGIGISVLGLLAIAFRDWRSLCLFVAATALVFVCLLGAMSLLGMQWNVFNLAALLLLLGTGTDYSILLLLALRRNGGDVPAARRELALVIFLCATSASAGFGTIGWANHAGLASLGKTCALGLIIDAAISVFLLPRAWEWLRQKGPSPNAVSTG
jgi:predicted RND superfamily exporter protein